MINYHDKEWGVPVFSDRKQFEFLVLESAQAGLSWACILRKRSHYKKAFAGFDPKKISKFGARDVQRLLKDEGIVRNRLKIEAAINNAGRFLEIRKEFGSFTRYLEVVLGKKSKTNCWKTLQELPAETPDSLVLSRDMKKRGFKFLGPTVLYSHLQAVGVVNDHLVSCFRYREINKLRRG